MAQIVETLSVSFFMLLDVSLVPYIFSVKLNDPTWYASLRGVSGSVAVIICGRKKKSNRNFGLAREVKRAEVFLPNEKGKGNDFGNCL
ncbi:MAG: hypothetical protein PHN80_06435 [Hespellia sp.]|nr:hypothetical protein [Hespellia sp.]